MERRALALQVADVMLMDEVVNRCQKGAVLVEQVLSEPRVESNSVVKRLANSRAGRLKDVPSLRVLAKQTWKTDSSHRFPVAVSDSQALNQAMACTLSCKFRGPQVP